MRGKVGCRAIILPVVQAASLHWPRSAGCQPALADDAARGYRLAACATFGEPVLRHIQKKTSPGGAGRGVEIEV